MFKRISVVYDLGVREKVGTPGFARSEQFQATMRAVNDLALLCLSSRVAELLGNFECRFENMDGWYNIPDSLVHAFEASNRVAVNVYLHVSNTIRIDIHFFYRGKGNSFHSTGLIVYPNGKTIVEYQCYPAKSS